MNKKIIIFLTLIAFLVSGIFLSFRLTQTPRGITVDEASIGYNAVLLSRNLHDESGRFLPFFPLTLSGQDWKQPITIYTTSIIFNIFGPSLLSLRGVSVMVSLISLILVVYLGYLMFGKSGGALSGILFITTPMILIHTHLAQENIMPIPFTLVWLIGIYLYSKKYNPWFLLLSGISLGLGLYSYKGMRAIIPVWAIITFVYILFTTNANRFNKKYLLNSLKNSLYFIAGILPFILIIPWLNTNYAGAVFETGNFEFKSFYTFLYPYLSSFDLSALFIKGDTLPIHSTGIHGVFLIATLPLFISGLVRAVKKDIFWIFLLVSFFATPILFGQVGSVYRFSRLLVFIPFFVVFSTLGIKRIYHSKIGKHLLPLFFLLFILNFTDFTRYYWFRYPDIEQSYFLANHESSYKQLAKISHEYNLKPFIFIDDFLEEKEAGKFFASAYFPDGLGYWKPGDLLPKNSVVMTLLKSQPNLKPIETPTEYYYFLTNI